MRVEEREKEGTHEGGREREREKEERYRVRVEERERREREREMTIPFSFLGEVGGGGECILVGREG